ncbi:hypothetical protein OUZ56_027198 [Daphnia magna]|uniref:Uncharacterized protein n=1 Tax=Daphnia magna TaxID=35525 RepID=A0ABQ9ZP29_9CRUS|nr:hypothetical protein OUZ56_027198 [Daphnia magna]
MVQSRDWLLVTSNRLVVKILGFSNPPRRERNLVSSGADFSSALNSWRLTTTEESRDQLNHGNSERERDF